MKSISLVMLALLSAASSATAAELGYNLRTVPTTPQAGVPFVVAFDSTICEIWVLPPQGEPPVVEVEGSKVRLEVDRLTIANCTFPPETNTLAVPPLPAGDYQLELIARAYLSPGNEILAQAVSFQVGPVGASSPFTVPTNSKAALATLVVLMLSLGYALFRQRA